MPRVSRKRGKERRGKGRSIAKKAADLSLAQDHVNVNPANDSLESLRDEARAEADPFLAVKVYRKALQIPTADVDIMVEAAELMLQLGCVDEAQEVLARSIAIKPDASSSQHLYMAQLHEGIHALQYYEKGLALLEAELRNSKSDRTGKGEEETLRRRLCMAYCSVAELFLTDLCFEESAEQRCQDALDQSMQYDYGGPEPVHAVANLRLSQHKPEEAVHLAREAFRRLQLCEPPPEQEFRISLAKVLLECTTHGNECGEQALDILTGLMEEDDESVETWYLMGFAFNSLQPPDHEQARTHLARAAEMLKKIEESQRDAGEAFPFQDQVQLVHEQLDIASQASREHQADQLDATEDELANDATVEESKMARKEDMDLDC